MVDITQLLPLILVGLALLWALWLVFKRDLLAQNLGKLISYFLGAALTFLAVGALTVWFLPSWFRVQLEAAENSTDVNAIQTIMSNSWEDATRSRSVPPATQAPSATTPASGGPVSPVVATPLPGGASIQSVQPGGNRTHLVQQGENLYRIAQQYNVTVDKIKQANGLTGDTIHAGDQLIIPAP